MRGKGRGSWVGNMSRSSEKRRRNKSKVDRLAERRSLDRGVYGAILLIGAFILLLWFLIANETFPHALVGFVLAVLGWINFTAIKAYAGAKLPDWQQALAKIPLQFAGYGREDGKPLAAAKHQPNARTAVFLFLAVSVILVVVLALLLIPEARL